jgi:hypothetical protein
MSLLEEGQWGVKYYRTTQKHDPCLGSALRQEVRKGPLLFHFHNIKNYLTLPFSTPGRAQWPRSSLEDPRTSPKPWDGTKTVHLPSIRSLVCSEEGNLVLVFMVTKFPNDTVINFTNNP